MLRFKDFLQEEFDTRSHVEIKSRPHPKWEHAVDGLSKDERLNHRKRKDYQANNSNEHLKTYTNKGHGTGSEDINHYVAHGHKSDHGPDMRNHVEKIADGVHKSFKPLHTDTTTYHGTGHENEHKIGDVITHSGHRSTSTHAHVAASFRSKSEETKHPNGGVSYSRKKDHGTIYRYHLPKGHHAIVTNAEEGEVILKHGSKYKVSGTFHDTHTGKKGYELKPHE